MTQRHSLGEQSGECHNEHQLGELRGLQPEERQLDPAVRPHLRVAAPDEEGSQQQEQRGQVDVRTPAGESSGSWRR